ncbi:hypothetical protein XPA_003156 [Xanthoria parietina]
MPAHPRVRAHGSFQIDIAVLLEATEIGAAEGFGGDADGEGGRGGGEGGDG